MIRWIFNIEKLTMPTLKERFIDLKQRLAKSFTPASFGIIDNRGEMYFVQADGFTVTKSGRLLFRRRGTLCAAVAEDKWERVLKGITLDDVEG